MEGKNIMRLTLLLAILAAIASVHEEYQKYSDSINMPFTNTPEVTPSGIARTTRESYTLRSIRGGESFPRISEGRHHQNTFQVTPSHAQLSKDRKGVKFNVETVPDALPENLNKARISRLDELDMIRQQFTSTLTSTRSPYTYTSSHNGEGFGNTLTKGDINIEATSEHEPDLIYQGGNGFIVAVVMAFDQHLPLELSPDHVWALITYAFAKHVDQHHNFVHHQGKRRIQINTPDSFQKAQENKPDTGATATEWEAHVFAQFSTAIRGYIGDKTHAALVANFTCTTPASRAASEVVLMAAMKNYFSFGMYTSRGIPEITLVGTEQDWIALRERADMLGKLMMPDFEAYWMPALLPVLDKFVESYQGRVDHGFWQSMVKLRHNGMGSGYSEFISGWIQIFFPHLGYVANRPMRQWNEFYFSGPSPDKFPSVDSFAPCDWDYHGTKYDLEFHAGITGVRQDPETGRLAPVTGWYVNHATPEPNAQRIDEVEKEIRDLRLGHEKELGYGQYYNHAWHRRLQELSEELRTLRHGNAGESEFWQGVEF